jgi:nitronate monooxygenase
MKHLLIATLLAAAAGAALAEYPDKPVTIVVPFAAGGPTDKVARDLGDVLRKQLNQPVIIENVGGAGGTLGAAKVADLQDKRFDFDVAIPQVLEYFKSAGLEGTIPLIAAGGISSRDDILRLQGLGASAVQLGTAFAVTRECDAADAFKQVLANAQSKDIVEFMSVSGLPARAVRTPWLNKYLRIVPKLQAAAHQKKKCNMSFDCLAHCGLRDGDASVGQFCIDQQLGHAFEGDTQKGLFFRGAGALPFGKEIRSVADLMQWLLGAIEPQPFTKEFV